MLASQTAPSPEISPLMAAFDRRQALARSDPLLAYAYLAEAAADRRIEAGVSAVSLLTMLRNRAREAVEAHTGANFENRLYPERAR
jgi:hypothetical protein